MISNGKMTEPPTEAHVLSDKTACVGCAACYSICPCNCISMEQDKEGFLYPIIDEKICTKCKQCEKICPAITQRKENKPLHVYAAKNPNEEIRCQSSSGGIFTMLAECIIHQGGVVFGAKFNENWEVVHSYTEAIEGLAAFRGSKYVQSKIEDTYKLVENFLMAEREVLFTGTPCQVAGLKAFLKKEYGNLLTVDLVCHGVPSPLVWKKYLDEIVDIVCSNAQRIIGIKFRDKIYGWKQLNISIEITSQDNHKSFFVESAEKNSFMRGFLQYIYLRPSCYKCPFKSLKSGSDITIADYWGIQNVLPEFDDDKGISLVMINTEKGKNFYKLLNKNDCETTYAEAFVGNSSIEKSEPLSAKRDVFFKRYLNEPIIQLINRLTADSLQVRIKKKIIVVLRWLGLLSFVKSLLKK